MTAIDPREIVFIDPHVTNIAAVLADLPVDAEAFVLNPGSDGLQQVADILGAGGLTDLSSIAFVSPDEADGMLLGSSLLTDSTLPDYSAQLAAIGAALAPGGAIRLYGSGVATATDGQQFVDQLSNLAGGVPVEAASQFGSDVSDSGLGEAFARAADEGAPRPTPSAAGAVDSAAESGSPLPAGSGAPQSPSSGGAITVAGPYLVGSNSGQPQSGNDSGGAASGDPTGQLWFGGEGEQTGTSSGQTDDRVGRIDSDGNGSTTVTTTIPSGSSTPGFGGVGLDAPDGLYFVLNSDLSLSSGKISTGAELDTVQIGSITDMDQVNGFAVDPYNDTIYIDLFGDDFSTQTDNPNPVTAADDGGDIIKVTYNPSTGQLTSPYNPAANDGYGSGFITQGGLFMDSTATSAAYQQAEAMWLSPDGSKLYYVDQDVEGGALGFDADTYTASTNGIYVVDVTSSSTNPTSAGTGPQPTLLSSQTQFPTNESNGAMTGLTVDEAKGLIYFTTDSISGAGQSQDALWEMPIGGGTATKMSLPAGVHLYFPDWPDTDGNDNNITLDTNAQVLYISDDGDFSSSTFGQGETLKLTLNATGSGFTSGSDFFTLDTTQEGAGSGDNSTTGLFFDSLPTLYGAGSGAPFSGIETAGQAVQGGGTVTLLTGDPTISDPVDGTEAGLSISVTNAQAGDELFVSGIQSGTLDGGLVTVAFNSSTHTLTLTNTLNTSGLTLAGAVPISEWETLLGGVSFQDAGTANQTVTSRTIDWVVSNGTTLTSATTSDPNQGQTNITVHVKPFVSAGATANFHGGGSPTTLDAGLTVSGPSSPALLSATVSIVGGHLTGDTLNFATQNNISGSFVSSVLTLTGSSSLANYEAALESITFGFTSGGDPTSGGSDTSRTIDWQVFDGTTSSTVVSSTINVSHTAPQVTAAGSATFDGGGSPVVLDGGLTVADTDSNGLFSGATVAIGGFISGDTLNFTNQNGISGSYNSGTGVETLTGSASVGAYQSALESITFGFTSGGDPTGGGSHTSRTIDWTVTDGSTQNGSATGSSTLLTVHVPPTLSNIPTAQAAVANGGSAILAVSATATDPDSSGNLLSATVVITSGGAAGDVLSANTSGTSITETYNSGTKTLSLSGTATLLQYDEVLETVSFQTTAGGGARALSWVVEDGNTLGGSSAARTETLNVAGVVSWTAGNGDWDTPADWSGGAVPSANDVAVIATGGAVTVTHVSGTAESVTSLLLSSDDTLAFTSGSLTVSSGITNSGTFDFDSAGVGGGVLTVGGTISNGGLMFVGNGGIASAVTVSAGALVNFGTIVVDGDATTELLITGAASDTGLIELHGSSSLLSAGGGLTVSTGGSIVNPGTIAGPTAITADGGGVTITNFGTIVGATTAIYGSGGAPAIVNSGSIGGATIGIKLAAGGRVTNNSGAVISGASYGVDVTGGGAFLINSGAIEGGAANGIYFQSASSSNYVRNAGTLTAAGYGIFNAYTVVNAGTITAVGDAHLGVDLPSGGFVTNQSQGYIYGGVAVNGGSVRTIVNQGTIVSPLHTGAFVQVGYIDNASGGVIVGSTGVSVDAGMLADAGTIVGNGGVAVSFSGGGSDLLVLENGYKLVGAVDGSGTAGATNTLELLGTLGNPVTANYSGLALSNFQDVLFGSGGAATLDVSNTNGTLPVTISGLNAPTDVIDLTGIGANGVIANLDTAANAVTVSGSLGSVTLQFSSTNINELTARSDGGNGVDIRLAAPRDDFSGSGVSNIFWQNNNGQLDLWTMNGASVTALQQPTYQGVPDAPSTATWSIAGIGDVTGDGKADVLWRSTAGALALWTMNGATVMASQPVTQGGTAVTQNATFAGIGHFNGAGNAEDLLWRNTDDTLSLWTMSGASVSNAQTVTFGGNPDTPGATWSVAGVGDFNGDGTTDVLWRNTDGELAVWTMSGATVTASQPVTFLLNLEEPGPTWSVAGIGDFTGNGHDDILWRNTDNTLALWTMNGGVVGTSQIVTFQGNADFPNSTWSVAGIGDYTGAGTEDILWRNTAGTLALWTMNGATVTSSQIVNSQGNALAPDNTWHVKT